MSSTVGKAKEVAHRVTGHDGGDDSDKSKYSASYQHPAQSQAKPGLERDLEPKPTKAHLPTEEEGYQLYRGSGKLQSKRALITGGDSGIGRAVAILFAIEGANLATTHLPEEQEDALHTKAQVEKNGGKIELIATDLRSRESRRDVIERAVGALGGLDILVNNAAYQLEQKDIADISEDQYYRTLETNLSAPFFLTQHALKHIGQGGSIINTVSVDAYIGPGEHLDYAATKGALLSFTRALANQQAPKGIRVNAVAPGPIWTPLIASSLAEGSQKQLPSWTALAPPRPARRGGHELRVPCLAGQQLRHGPNSSPERRHRGRFVELF